MSGLNFQRRPERPGGVAPAARDVVAGNLSAGVIVLDPNNQVADLNAAAAHIIGPRATGAIGHSVARVLADHPNLIARCYDGTDAHIQIKRENGAAPRHFDVHISPLTDDQGRPDGRLLVLRDITADVHAQEAQPRAEIPVSQPAKERTVLWEADAIVSDPPLDLSEVLSEIAAQMGQTVNATSAYICSFDLRTMTSSVLAEYYSPSARTPERVSDLGKTYQEELGFLEKLQASQFDIDHIDDPALSEELRAHMQAYGAQSVLSIPLRARGKVIGFAELWESRRRRDFTLTEVGLCRAIAQNAATAIEISRLYEQAQQELAERARAEEQLRNAQAEIGRKLAEQTFLRESTALISSSLDTQIVLTRIAEQMARAIDATSAYFCSWEPETRSATVVAEYFSPEANALERVSDLGVSYVDKNEKFLNALKADQPWTDHVDDPDVPEGDKDVMRTFGAQSVLYVPLCVRGHVNAYAELYETRRRREFTADEISLCQAIAQNAAIALENARLYEQAQQELSERVRAEKALRELNEGLEQRVRERTAELSEMNAQMRREISDRKQAEAEYRRRNRELLSLQAAATATSSSLDLPFLLETVTWEMADLFKIQSCTIFEWDQEADAVSIVSEYGREQPREEGLAAQTLELARYPSVKRALAERSALHISSGQPDINSVEQAYLQQEQTQVLLLVPMIFQARVVGLVEMRDKAAERTFSDHEISLAQLLANQAASAIENARLYAETQHRLREQTALREAVSVISSALDPQTVLTRIAEQMGQGIDATSSYICSFDPAFRQATVLAEYFGPDACPQEQRSDLGASYQSQDVEFLKAMQAGQHDTAQADDPHLLDPDRTHMDEFGTKSILYIPLLIKGQLLGFAELWESRRRREFTPEEISLCKGIAQQAAVAIDNAQLYEKAQQEIAERVQAEEQIKSSLKEKEVLLQEIHHRVKNNLQVVSSLLNLQSRYVEDETALGMFQESQNRILSMALIHEKLYRSQDLARIDLAEYIRTLATDLIHSYRAHSGTVTLQVNATDVFLTVENAVPCGLIVNELVSNALKHAFPLDADAEPLSRNGKDNKIHIDLSADEENRVTLIVGDNGVGFPQDLDVQTMDSLGLRLVHTLVSQLEGTLDVQSKEGTKFILVFSQSPG